MANCPVVQRPSIAPRAQLVLGDLDELTVMQVERDARGAVGQDADVALTVLFLPGAERAGELDLGTV
jgi:hypothetical protein